MIFLQLQYLLKHKNKHQHPYHFGINVLPLWHQYPPYISLIIDKIMFSSFYIWSYSFWGISCRNYHTTSSGSTGKINSYRQLNTSLAVYHSIFPSSYHQFAFGSQIYTYSAYPPLLSHSQDTVSTRSIDLLLIPYALVLFGPSLLFSSFRSISPNLSTSPDTELFSFCQITASIELSTQQVVIKQMPSFHVPFIYIYPTSFSLSYLVSAAKDPPCTRQLSSLKEPEASLTNYCRLVADIYPPFAALTTFSFYHLSAFKGNLSTNLPSFISPPSTTREAAYSVSVFTVTSVVSARLFVSIVILPDYEPESCAYSHPGSSAFPIRIFVPDFDAYAHRILFLIFIGLDTDCVQVHLFAYFV